MRNGLGAGGACGTGLVRKRDWLRLPAQ